MLLTGVMYTTSAYYNSKTMKIAANKMSAAAQKATANAFVAEVITSIIMVIMPCLALVLGGAILNFINLGLGVLSFIAVIIMLGLESSAWNATTTGAVSSSVFGYGEAVAAYFALLFSIGGGVLSIFFHTTEIYVL